MKRYIYLIIILALPYYGNTQSLFPEFRTWEAYTGSGSSLGYKEKVLVQSDLPPGACWIFDYIRVNGTNFYRSFEESTLTPDAARPWADAVILENGGNRYTLFACGSSCGTPPANLPPQYAGQGLSGTFKVILINYSNGGSNDQYYMGTGGIWFFDYGSSNFYRIGQDYFKGNGNFESVDAGNNEAGIDIYATGSTSAKNYQVSIWKDARQVLFNQNYSNEMPDIARLDKGFDCYWEKHPFVRGFQNLSITGNLYMFDFKNYTGNTGPEYQVSACNSTQRTILKPVGSKRAIIGGPRLDNRPLHIAPSLSGCNSRIGSPSSRIAQAQSAEKQQGIVYPNPTRGHTRLALDLTRPEKLTARVYNNQGRVVQTILVNKQLPAGPYNLDVDLTSLKEGYYLIRVEGQQGTLLTSKIIKE
ncbi:T9SS type A sorting domain-containing protein [Roseivirga sp. BDSF3-8]|uniref:T9SS type A sorting domain-containing protein n=1 Tax=Roseivirga sp. BDSF3-8 TaxID=3241598 RepID=UPI0035326AB1